MGDADLGLQELLLLALIGICIIPVIFFLITLQNTLKAVEPQNRSMKPGNVWLILIPVFGFVWSIVMVNAIANSCKTQLEQYGVFYEQKPTYSIGMGWVTCSILSMVINLFSFVAIVMLIVYWIKVNDVRKQLLALKQIHDSKDENSIL